MILSHFSTSKQIKVKKKGFKLRRCEVESKRYRNVCNFGTDMLTVVSGDMMALTSVSMKIVGTVCLSPILPKSVCICSCAELVMMSLSAIRVFIVLMLTKKGPFRVIQAKEQGFVMLTAE